jgi:hypothetical protein
LGSHVSHADPSAAQVTSSADPVDAPHPLSLVNRNALMIGCEKHVQKIRIARTDIHLYGEVVKSTDLIKMSRSFDAAVLTEREAAQLHSEAGAPAFRLEHIFCDFADRLVSWGHFICAGDRLHFTAAIGVPASGMDRR